MINKQIIIDFVTTKEMESRELLIGFVSLLFVEPV